MRAILTDAGTLGPQITRFCGPSLTSEVDLARTLPDFAGLLYLRMGFWPAADAKTRAFSGREHVLARRVTLQSLRPRALQVLI